MDLNVSGSMVGASPLQPGSQLRVSPVTSRLQLLVVGFANDPPQLYDLAQIMQSRPLHKLAMVDAERRLLFIASGRHFLYNEFCLAEQNEDIFSKRDNKVYEFYIKRR